MRHLVAALILGAAGVCAAAPPAAVPGVPPPLDIPFTRATRLLVVSPHPDDGSLGGAGLMLRVLSRGGSVRVVHVTSGDAFSTGVKLVDRIDRP
ncbi:MAG TPA: PIG-L family deacetylase, partial [Rhodanobacteraceae bacterium]